MNRWYYRLLVLVFLGVFITVGIHPVFSQIPTVKPIKQELTTDIKKPTQDKNTCYIPDEVGEVNDAKKLMEIGKNCYEIGNFVYAVTLLEKAVTIFNNQKDQQINLAITYANLSLAYQQLSEVNLSELSNFKKSNQQLSNLQLAELNIAESFKILTTQNNIDEKKKQQVLGQVWNIKGKLQFAQGKVEKALISWEEAAGIYRSIGNQYGKLSSQINQVQALQALGLFEPASNKVEEILGELEKNQTQIPGTLKFNLKLKTLVIKGDILRAVGELDQSKKILETLETEILDKSKNNLDDAQAQTPEDRENKNAALLSLGNTLLAQANLARDREATANYEYMPWRCDKKDIPENFKGKYKEAIKEYDNVGKSQGQSITEIKAKLNRLRILIDLGNLKDAQDVEKEISVDELPNSRGKVYARINFAKSLACLQQKKPDSQIKDEEIIGQLTTAIKDAKDLSIEKDAKKDENSKDNREKDENLKDNRAISYALGNLGGLYEYFGSVNQQQQQNTQGKEAKKCLDKDEKLNEEDKNCLHKAQKLTEEALYLAQPAQMPDIAYQWQWQLGRLFGAKGENERAINEYENSVATLESVRSDLLGINSDVQFNFRDNVEPIYRGLMDLLVKTKGSSDLIQTYLKKAITTIDSLQLAELENFLRCNLSNTQEKEIQIDKFNDSKTLIIYPIILEDRLSIIFKISRKDKKLGYIEKKISSQQIEKTLQELRDSLIEGADTPEVIKNSKIVYGWLIKPLEAIINGEPQVKNLVFVLDGLLRNIPMAVLYDGNQYLVEKNYDIAVVPGFNLFTPQSAQTKLNVFIGGVGLAQPELGFEKIQHLREELDGISRKITTSNPLIDEQFTKSNIQQQLQRGNFSAIHWKTHGVFSSDPEKNFILAYKEQIKANDLKNLIQTGSKNKNQPLDLLVLSACETAKGDNRSILGLAGIAARSGARSTLSTLWKADDSTKANTKFMIKFYEELSKPGATKAQALHQAQLYLFKELGYNAPNIWGTYILVGNWL